MKILVLGCGSIGSRHARNSRSLGVGSLVLVDPNLARARRLGRELGTGLVYGDYRSAARANPDLDAAIICTPSSLHVRPATFFVRNGTPVLIEKPLSDSLRCVSALSKLRSKNRVMVMMGHSFMFEAGFVKLKSLLDRGAIGKIHFASYLQGQYLPDWHPREDYRKEYTARADLGGGALLTLTSHSFYILEWLFGPIGAIHGSFIGRVGGLGVDVDDTVFLLFRTRGGIPIQSQNNFITSVHQHRLVVEGSKGVIEQDFANQRLTVTLRGSKPRVISTRADNNARFLDEMRYFLRALKTGRLEKRLDLDSGIRFLEVIKHARGFPARSGL